MLTFGQRGLSYGQNERALTNREPWGGPGGWRSMIYAIGQRHVRMRTCNDHVTIVVADLSEAMVKAGYRSRLLLIVMPLVERTRQLPHLCATGRRKEREDSFGVGWQQRLHKGVITTWNIGFREDAPGKANNDAENWKGYAYLEVRFHY